MHLFASSCVSSCRFTSTFVTHTPLPRFSGWKMKACKRKPMMHGPLSVCGRAVLVLAE